MTAIIRPFTWDDWRALWRLRLYQLAEAGIVVPDSAIPAAPEDVAPDDHEWDYHHIAEVYLSGKGGFWLAWADAVPIGHIAAQDLGAGIELRHMYVRLEYRRQGAGSQLVQALLEHCAVHGVRAIELWTATDGLGRKLYERQGFIAVGAPGPEFAAALECTRYTPGDDEVRMRWAG